MKFLLFQRKGISRFTRTSFLVSIVLGLFMTGVTTGWIAKTLSLTDGNGLVLVQGEKIEKEYPLLKYSFPNLKSRPIQTSPIEILRVAKTEPEFTSYVITFSSEGKKVSGMMNVPTTPVATQSALPVVMMVRGFVEPEEYEIGKGTQHVAERFVKKGYVTIAPDFLAFGESDPEPPETFAGRFIKPITVIDLLNSLPQYQTLPIVYKNQAIVMFDSSKVGLWGHSNGGQISLSVLEVTGKNYPTALWAPVTKQFPYSVLYFTDDYEDQGKALRATVAEFEKDYNIDEFTIGKNIDNINAKIQLHQGTLDDAVPKSWSDDFYSLMVGKGKKDNIEYFVYEQTDHGLYPNVDVAAERDIKFFDKELGVSRNFADLLKK